MVDTQVIALIFVVLILISAAATKIYAILSGETDEGFRSASVKSRIDMHSAMGGTGLGKVTMLGFQLGIKTPVRSFEQLTRSRRLEGNQYKVFFYDYESFTKGLVNYFKRTYGDPKITLHMQDYESQYLIEVKVNKSFTIVMDAQFSYYDESRFVIACDVKFADVLYEMVEYILKNPEEFTCETKIEELTNEPSVRVYTLSYSPKEGFTYNAVSTTKLHKYTKTVFPECEVLLNGSKKKLQNPQKILGKVISSGLNAYLTGPTGSGKTAMINAALHEAERDVVIFLPSSVFLSMGKEANNIFSDAIISRFSDSTVTFIIDEADQLVAKKDEKEFAQAVFMPLLSGMLADMGEFNFVLSFNLPFEKVSAEMARPGRADFVFFVEDLGKDRAYKALDHIQSLVKENDTLSIDSSGLARVRKNIKEGKPVYVADIYELVKPVDILKMYDELAKAILTDNEELQEKVSDTLEKVKAEKASEKDPQEPAEFESVVKPELQSKSRSRRRFKK